MMMIASVFVKMVAVTFDDMAGLASPSSMLSVQRLYYLYKESSIDVR